MKKNKSGKTSTANLIPLLVADVFELAGSFRRWGDQIAGESRQTQARWQVLSAASVDNVTVAQIAWRLGLARQGVQRIADLLVEDGLTKYSDNPQNARSPHLCVTSRGKAVLEKLTKIANVYHRELAEGFSSDELQIALVVLRKLCMQLDRDLTAND